MSAVDDNIITRLEQLLQAVRQKKYDQDLKLGSVHLSDLNLQDDFAAARLRPYLAPELLQQTGTQEKMPQPGDKHWQYIFAALLYEELANGYYLILPPGVEPLEITPLDLAGYIQAHPPVPRRRLPQLSPELKSWFARALQPDPARRFPDVEQMVHAAGQLKTLPPVEPVATKAETLPAQPLLPPRYQRAANADRRNQKVMPGADQSALPVQKSGFRSLSLASLIRNERNLASSSGALPLDTLNPPRSRPRLLFSRLVILAVLGITAVTALGLYFLANSKPEVQLDWVLDRGLTTIDKAREVAIDSNGNVYVASEGNLQILKYSKTGQLLKNWGGFGKEHGRFADLLSVAVDEENAVYAADPINMNIQKFDANGQFLARWESPDANRPYQINSLVAGRDNFIYGSSQLSREIFKWNKDGQLLARWGSAGLNGEGQFDALVAIDVDKNSVVYALSGTTRQVQKFDGQGKFIEQWKPFPSGEGDGQFSHPLDLSVTEAGEVYIVDHTTHRLEKFDKNGNYLSTLGVYGYAAGQFRLPATVAQDREGNIYVGEFANNRVQKFNATGQPLAIFGDEPHDRNFLHQPYAVAANESAVYIVDNNNFRIVKLDSKGKFNLEWGKRGDGNGEFSFGFYDMAGIAVNAEGEVYVVDSYNQRIQKFDKNGNFILKWGSAGSSEGQFNIPSGIAIDKLGNVYIADTFNQRIQKFNSTGVFISSFGGQGSNAGQFNQPNGLTIDSQNNLYVADRLNDRVQKFDLSGRFISQFGTTGSAKGQFQGVGAVAFDSKNNIYVSDIFNGRIQKFDPNGQFLFSWGKRGLGDGEFNMPFGLAITVRDELYLADSNGSRVYKYLLNSR